MSTPIQPVNQSVFWSLVGKLDSIPKGVKREEFLRDFVSFFGLLLPKPGEDAVTLSRFILERVRWRFRLSEDNAMRLLKAVLGYQIECEQLGKPWNVLHRRLWRKSLQEFGLLDALKPRPRAPRRATFGESLRNSQGRKGVIPTDQNANKALGYPGF